MARATVNALWISTLLTGAQVAFSAPVHAQANLDPFSNARSYNNVLTEREALKELERNPEKGLPTLSPANIKATKAAIKKYEEIVANGGWEEIPDVKLKPGQSSPAVDALRKRLSISGEYEGGLSWGSSLSGDILAALRLYQLRNGLTQNGRLDPATVAALNVPAKDRLKQLKVNLKRLQTLIPQVKKHRKYVIANIPAAQVEAIARNKVISRHTGVVGKIDRQTPLLKTRITNLNFNPTWRLPPTVIKKDLIPQGRRMQKEGGNVLLHTGIEAYSGGRKLDPKKINWNSKQPYQLSYRQPPGKDNPLGFVKINFPNQYSVYMHDSPGESLFGRNFRAASSGCIRVHNVERLANWLLGLNDGWNMDRVLELKKSGKKKNVRLAASVPLRFIYISAWATEDGVINFRRDIYKRDGVSQLASAY